MPEPAASLLDRLRYGRGDAVRELLCMPRDQAGEVLLDCLCTPDVGSRLITQCEGYVELLLTLQPPLQRWFARIAALPVDCEEDHVAFPMHMLHEAAVRGSVACHAFLLEQLRSGHHWRQALHEFLTEQLTLPEDLWHELLPSLSAADLGRFVEDRTDWQERALRWPAVAEALALKRAHDASFWWSMPSYDGARGSPKRWAVLAHGLAVVPQAVAPLLVEGLWDADEATRCKCIEHVDVRLPGVKQRLEVLASSGSDSCRHAAQVRFAEVPESQTMACDDLEVPLDEAQIPDLLACGRGAAVRELLRMPRERAAALVMQLLTDPEQTCHSWPEGLCELLTTLDPPLQPWFDFFDALADDHGTYHKDDVRRLMAAMAARGSASCKAFLIDRGLDDASLARQRAKHWQREDYECATSSQRRWQFLKQELARDVRRVQPLLVDGLWDASVHYRGCCLELVDLDLPSVRERMVQLAQSPQPNIAELAQKRLAAAPC
jgi:hypothetical protein